LRGEADGDEAGDAVGAEFADDVGDVRMPVAHAGVNTERCSGGGEGLLEQMGLRECPPGKRRSFVAGRFAETDLGVAVLKFFHNFFWEAAAAGNFAEVFGHLAEDIGGSVGEEKDGGLVGLQHGFDHPIRTLPLGIDYVHHLPNKPLTRPSILQDLDNKGDSFQDLQNAGVMVSLELFGRTQA
jgi:hypothetical protein